jgi:serpin B
VVNQAWGQNNFEFRTEYLDTLAVHYGSGLYLLDFVTQQEQSAHIINDWVREQTEDKIQDLIEPSLITPETRLVLTNAVYFNAAWAVPFEAADTASENFTTLAGHTIQIPTMQQVAQLRYADTESWQAVELPYDGDELAMVIVLPKEGALGSIEGNLASVLDEAVAQLSDHMVTLSMPKFQFEFQQSLKEPLINLGMTDAFDGADFSGINESVPLKIQDVIHQSFVSVDEAGTEAAAATAVILGLRSAPESAEIHLNRPFIFAIRDNATGAIVFLGRLADPSALN